MDNVSLNFEAGAIHALVGENGAGKSTFARLCTGHLHTGKGKIIHNDKVLNLRSIRAGIDEGLVLVPQHPQLSPELTVWENIAIGLHTVRRNAWLYPRKTPADLLAALKVYGIRLPLLQKAGTLDSSQLHWTVIGGALLNNPSVLFLDEPSASFSPQETEQLYTLLRKCADTGMCVIVVTHRIQEVMMRMDFVHILRSGQTVRSSRITPQISAAELLQDIFGPTYTAVTQPAREVQQKTPGKNEEGLTLSRIYACDGKDIRFSDFSLQAPCGRITGVVGIKKQGLELLEDLLIRAVLPAQGTIRFKGQPLCRLTREMSAYIPSKRMRRGIAHRHSIAENLYVRARSSLYTCGVFSARAAAAWKRGSLFDIPRSWGEPVISLSGGMMQKLIFSRELDNPVPQLVICAEPYWGLDRKVQLVLLQKLRRLAAAGAAVLVLTSDADAALETCDCIHIVYRGALTGFMEAPAYNRSALLAAMMQAL
ncbi:MAG: ATP-binding cassette domain-containing protein [Treponema sp.]